MIELYADNTFRVVALEQNDFELFVEAFSACLLDKSEDDPEFVADLTNAQRKVRENASEFWQAKLEGMNSANFVLLRHDKPIGAGQAVFDEDRTHAVLGELHILKQHRGGLSGKGLKHLLDHSFDFLIDNTPIQSVFAQIDNGNEASQKVAERFGLRALDADTGDDSKLFMAVIDRDQRKLVPASAPGF